jgi:hypothetical protein
MQESRTLGLLLALSILGAPALAGEDPAERFAMRLVVSQPAFTEPEVAAAKSMPPQFVLSLTREMPTPGWTFDVDALDVDAEARRIVARVTERSPGGMTAQVITPARLSLPLGSLEPGPYFFELWLRRGTKREHRPTHALVLIAAP